MFAALRLNVTAFRFLLGIALLSAPVAPVLAMSVQPTQVEMIAVGQHARAQVTVTNDSAAAMPVELSIERLMLDEKGSQRKAAAGDNFLIFPPQAMIAPGSSQVFRLQWVGEPTMSQSESYMISVNQIPVAAPKGRNSVQIVMAMGVLVNIAPASGAASLRLVDTAVATEKGKKQLAITVENPTNVHALLPEAKIRLTSGSWSHTLEKSEIGNGVGIGLVQPGKRRRFVLPVDMPASVQSVQASIEYAPAKR